MESFSSNCNSKTGNIIAYIGSLLKVLITGSVSVQRILSSAKAIANATMITSPTNVVTLHVVPHPCRLAARVTTIWTSPESAFAHFEHLRPDQCFWKSSVRLWQSLLVKILLMISRLVYFVRVETATEFFTCWARVASWLCVRRFNMLPESCSDGGCEPAGDAEPASSLSSSHQGSYFPIQVTWS